MSSLKLEVPVFNLLENYYIKVLEAFSDTLKEEDKPFILNASRPSNLMNKLDKYPAVISLYMNEIERSKIGNTNQYKQDTLVFLADVYTAYKKESEYIKADNQDELSYKVGLMYSNWVRSALQDYKTKNPTIKNNDGKNIPFTSNFRWLKCENLLDPNEFEISVACQRQYFMVDVPYYPTDSNNYVELKEVLSNINIASLMIKE